MFRLPRLFVAGPAQRQERAHRSLLTARARLLWTVGNSFMLLGVIVLLYVCGLYATEEYGRYAARGAWACRAARKTAASYASRLAHSA